MCLDGFEQEYDMNNTSGRAQEYVHGLQDMLEPQIFFCALQAKVGQINFKDPEATSELVAMWRVSSAASKQILAEVLAEGADNLHTCCSKHDTEYESVMHDRANEIFAAMQQEMGGVLSARAKDLATIDRPA